MSLSVYFPVQVVLLKTTVRNVQIPSTSSGLHASPQRGEPASGPDHGAAKTPGKLQPAADRHVWHH